MNINYISHVHNHAEIIATIANVVAIVNTKHEPLRYTTGPLKRSIRMHFIVFIHYHQMNAIVAAIGYASAGNTVPLFCLCEYDPQVLNCIKRFARFNEWRAGSST